MRHTRKMLLVGSLVTACAAHVEPDDAAGGDVVSPGWAEVTAVQEDGAPRTLAKHDFAGNVELPDGEGGKFLHFYTPVVVARTGVYAGGKRLLRLDDGRLPGDVRIVDSEIRSLRVALEPLVAERGRTHRIG